VAPGQKDELTDHINRLRCRDRIMLPGVITGADKDRALAESQCLVLPSYAEGLPMAILEGMAASLPVIGTAVGAVAELIVDGVTGYVVPQGDVQALADRLSSLAGDETLRHRMGTAARRRAEEHYSMDVVTRRIMEIYAEVLYRDLAPGLAGASQQSAAPAPATGTPSPGEDAKR
jgi:glycosyltransferase involved in cell wall biosynthesis